MELCLLLSELEKDGREIKQMIGQLYRSCQQPVARTVEYVDRWTDWSRLKQAGDRMGKPDDIWSLIDALDARFPFTRSDDPQHILLLSCGNSQFPVEKISDRPSPYQICRPMNESQVEAEEDKPRQDLKIAGPTDLLPVCAPQLMFTSHDGRRCNRRRPTWDGIGMMCVNGQCMPAGTKHEERLVNWTTTLKVVREHDPWIDTLEISLMTDWNATDHYVYCDAVTRGVSDCFMNSSLIPSVYHLTRPEAIRSLSIRLVLREGKSGALAYELAHVRARLVRVYESMGRSPDTSVLDQLIAENTEPELATRR